MVTITTITRATLPLLGQKGAQCGPVLAGLLRDGGLSGTQDGPSPSVPPPPLLAELNHTSLFLKLEDISHSIKGVVVGGETHLSLGP